MKRRFLLIGTVLIVGNVAFAVTLRQPHSQEKEVSVQSSDMAYTVVADLLHARGLEHESALTKAKALFGNDPVRADRQLQILLKEFDGVAAQTLYDYLAKQALFSRVVDFTSYDALVRMVHETTGKHPDAGERQRLKQIAQKSAALPA